MSGQRFFVSALDVTVYILNSNNSNILNSNINRVNVVPIHMEYRNLTNSYQYIGPLHYCHCVIAARLELTQPHESTVLSFDKFCNVNHNYFKYLLQHHFISPPFLQLQLHKS